jgi:hypothetical protein
VSEQYTAELLRGTHTVLTGDGVKVYKAGERVTLTAAQLEKFANKFGDAKPVATKQKTTRTRKAAASGKSTGSAAAGKTAAKRSTSKRKASA